MLKIEPKLDNPKYCDGNCQKLITIPIDEYKELKEVKEMLIKFRQVLVEINNSMY